MVVSTGSLEWESFMVEYMCLKDGSKFFQCGAQMFAGAVNPGFDGGSAGIECLGDFVIAEVLLLE